ncbi:MAG: NAD(P)/FAD-dependent oxidoreductase [Gammaproteobacteria bacterium]|nr:NAD(P)/FAD-dependent oxidoreductase [Gammaproteobacteria bacterium]MDH5593364.1 NAD(P)/FAD-dependent oxidoreductase [Gammaproteobacteria bacterium]MDH5613961.1 NAD(P)/FAD-dependent oxidoreductase [Gammaproteobacteria bacterium]
MQSSPIQTEVLIIGASASGLMCAIEAGKRGRKVIVLDHANKAGKKILMSGGGRCNFTNQDVSASHYISHNPHFCKSALSRYTQWDFIAMVNEYQIPYHERDHGQLFCNDSAKDILNMLLAECRKVNVQIKLNCKINTVSQTEDNLFSVNSSSGDFQTNSLVIASGGLSIPKMCASPFGYKIAEQFGHHIWPTTAGLVPFTLQPYDKERLSDLSGIAVDAVVSNDRARFRENILFTHRGLSGPAILQISSYWQPGEAIDINLLPDLDLMSFFKERQAAQPNIKLKTLLSEILPKRLIPAVLGNEVIENTLQELSHVRFNEIIQQLQHWQIKPNGTEGYRTAEVTLGGVDCNELSSKTMESNKVKGLYFIGEVVDVTGWLGGYNFQWAWSSGWCAGQVV